MSVNGITSAMSAYTSQIQKNRKVDAKSDTSAKAGETSEANSTGVTYQKSKISEEDREALVKKLQGDLDVRVNQMKDLVSKMFEQQGIKFQDADDMWKKLASGEFTVDEETARKAQEEISEDGYWGVENTSQRIFDFAMALSGGDEEKMRKMQDAVEKGFAQATKAWGRTMPDITSKTHEAVNEKFKDFFGEE